MPKTWIDNHIEHAEYNRDASLAAADLARIKFRASQRFLDFKDWKDNIRQAWAMRRIVRTNRSKVTKD